MTVPVVRWLVTTTESGLSMLPVIGYLLGPETSGPELEEVQL